MALVLEGETFKDGIRQRPQVIRPPQVEARKTPASLAAS